MVPTAFNNGLVTLLLVDLHLLYSTTDDLLWVAIGTKGRWGGGLESGFKHGQRPYIRETMHSALKL